MSGLFKTCIACNGRYSLIDTTYLTEIFWLKATLCHTHTHARMHVYFARSWSLSVYPALFFSVLFSPSPLPPPPMFLSVVADWQIEAEVSPSPPGPAAHCDPLLSVRLCWYGRVTSGASSRKPYTMTQKWTPPVVQWLRKNLLLKKRDARKLFSQIRSFYTMKAECSMSALGALESAEIWMLLLIEYKLVFNKILFQEICDYLSVDLPTVSVHFKAGDGGQRLLILNPS